MDLNQLRYAVAVAEEQSFSKAAHKLGLTQPALSQQIKRLEIELGRPLFDRLPRRVVPSHAGEQLLAHARRILAQVIDARRQLGEASGEVSGPLTIGVIPTIAPFVLPRMLAELSRRFPAVEPRVVEDVTDRLIDMLERGELDAAVISSHGGSRTVHVEKLGEEPLLLMLPRRHRLARPRARRRAASWAQLRGERLLILHEMHCLGGQVSQLCDRQGLRPPIVLRGAQLSTIAAMVGAGMGVSIVPEMMRRSIDPASAAVLPFADAAPRRELAVAWSLLRYRTAASRALVEILRQLLSPRPSRRPKSTLGPSPVER